MNDHKTKNKLKPITDASERFGAIGSPSTTLQLTVDIFGAAADMKLLGELGVLRYLQNGIDHYALGQITEIILRNRMLEQAIGKGIVREREKWSAVQGRQDTHTATMNLSAVFSQVGETIEPSIFGTVPPTGTSIHFVKNEILELILESYRGEIFYLGQAYGSDLNLPMWFRHFESGESGQGEAYNIGIFGRTGSGKSVLAQMLMLAYARHKRMSIFVLDPQGEFSKTINKNIPSVDIPKALEMGNILHRSVLSSFKRQSLVIGVDGLILDRWEIFTETLVSLGFYFDLGVKKKDYQHNMADYVEHRLRKSLKLKELHKKGSLKKALEAVIETVDNVYAEGKSVTRVTDKVNEILQEPDSDLGNRIRKSWEQASSLFKFRKDAKKIDSIVKETLLSNSSKSREFVVIDLSKSLPEIPTVFWNKHIKPLLIDRFLKALIDIAGSRFDEEKSFNTLVVIDEAHRLAPRERFEDDRWRSIKSRLVDAVKTTRKYGLGWLFISQELAGLDRTIVNQLRTTFFGFGLGSGVELQALRELVGGDREYLRLYQSFRDPHSSLTKETRKYSFMALGPVSPLSFSGAPLFFDAYTDSEKFLTQNRIFDDSSFVKQYCKGCKKDSVKVGADGYCDVCRSFIRESQNQS